MPNFDYKMSDAYGQLRDGTMTADDELQLANRIRDLGGVLISAKQQATHHPKSAKIDRRDLITLTQHLLTATEAGISLLQSLRGYAKQSEKPDLASALMDLAHGVESGQGLSESMARYPKLFPELYVNMIAAGEISGQLEPILGRLVSYLEWRDEMARDLKQATVYPVAVITLVVGLIIFLLAFVLPRFTGIFTNADMELPLATQILMAAGNLFTVHWPWLIAGSVILGAGFSALLKHAKGVVWLDRQRLKLPLFGRANRDICLSQFTYSLSLLLGSGVAMTQALILANGAVTNKFLHREMVTLGDQVAAGHSLTDAFRNTGQFPGLAMQMIAVGEESGSLPEALDRCTNFLRSEVQHRLKIAFKVMEPAITLFLGIVVGGIALTIFYTMYKMIMHVGGGNH